MLYCNIRKKKEWFVEFFVGGRICNLGEFIEEFKNIGDVLFFKLCGK